MELTNTQTVIIDFRHNTTVPLPRYIQYDSNVLKFVIRDNGKDADLSNVSKIVVSTKRPDGIVTQRLLHAEGNVITYNIGNEEQKVVGYAELTLQFFNMEQLLSSRRLKVYFAESLGAEFRDGAGYPILQELFIEVGEVANMATDATNLAIEKANLAEEAAGNANAAAQSANTATDNANLATEAAQQSTQAANTAANNAETATQSANTATTAANEAAQTANTAAANADTATASANEAATNANNAANTANIAATNADEKAALADEKAGLAQAKVNELSSLNETLTQSITNADAATDAANTAATNANDQAGHAKTQGDYAKTQGDKVQTIIDAGGAVFSVNGKTGAEIELSATDVDAVATVNGIMPDENGNVTIDIPDPPPPEASNVSVADEENLFTATNVEDALTEIQKGVLLHKASDAKDAHNISNITGLQNALNGKQDASADNAKFKKGSAVYTDNDTSQTFSDAFCTPDSLVTVVITSTTPPKGTWLVDSSAGSFTITSTVAEDTSIAFDYYIQKAVG